MLTDQEIEARALEFGLNPNDVEKDYVHSWVLKAIYSRPLLTHHLVLKGGSALRKGYLPNTRFAKDLDFSAQERVDPQTLEKELREVCTQVEYETKVKFLDRTVVKDKELPIPGVEALEARMYFKGFYNEENITLKTQLDVTQFDRIYLPIQNRPLLHPYLDAAACVATLRCQKVEEILASKLTTLLHRRKAGDLFDLLYSILFANEFAVTRREVITTFLKKSIFEPQPEAAREQLLAIPLGDYESLWPTVLAPASTLFSFARVRENFSSLIGSLFDLLIPAPVPARVSGFSRGGGGFGGSPRFFAQGPRGTIISAGQARTMVELVYDGYRRLVEPYSFQYAIRKKDGVGLEYFWGFDTTGGKSGEVGIKRFICEKIQSASPTSQRFMPRWPVEL